ncbi:MAG: YlbF family regulator [Clostridia bacterium]|nr:YlbF family regulator [Clostridia bacterium]
MDILQLAREIGKEIQKDQRYIDYHQAKEITDNDKELKDLLKEFDKIRENITKEAQDQNRDEAKLNKLNEKIKDHYAKIMSNENMIRFNAAQAQISALLNNVTTIISRSVSGENPDEIDLGENCTGSCSTCSGCH